MGLPLFVCPAWPNLLRGGGGETMAKSAVDRAGDESRKRGGPKKTASKGNAKTGESGDAAAAEKPMGSEKSATEGAAVYEEKEKEATRGVRKALREAVKKAVKTRCSLIAQRLMDGIENGDVRSTAAVLSMIEKKKDEEGHSRHGGLTAADLPRSEEEWERVTAEEMERLGTRIGEKGPGISGQ